MVDNEGSIFLSGMAAGAIISAVVTALLILTLF
jgi:hypothetical protein